MPESLKGIKGWLLFFTVCFALSGLIYIGQFFTAMTDLSTASAVVSLIFTPILAVAAIVTTVFIAMEKKLGKWLAVGTLGFGAIAGVTQTIVTFADGSSGTTLSAPLIISAILIGLIGPGLIALYFFVSKRVKETLVK